MKFFKPYYLMLVVMAMAFISCDPEDESTLAEEHINISDGNAVSEALTFKNGTATTENGAFPTSSTDTDAPVIDEYSEESIAIAGRNFSLEIYERTGKNVEGVYLQVKGSDKYYDIKIGNTNNGGRLFHSGSKKSRTVFNSRLQDHRYLLIGLSEELGAGNFCISFSAYDDQKRVSNVVEACIEVVRTGGDNSGFITANKWEMVSSSYKEVYEGTTYEDSYIIGETEFHTFSSSLDCNDGTSQQVEVTNEYTTNYSYITFSPNGEMALEDQEDEKTFDYESSTCETGPIYVETSETENEAGYWSYNDSKKELTVLFEYTYENQDGVEETDADIERYNIAAENGQLKIFSEWQDPESDNSYYSEMIFRPRQ